MRQEVNVLYRNTAEEFARKVVTGLASGIHSVILHGSVARRQARRGSDIDVLIVGAEPSLRDAVLDIAYSMMEDLRFETLINVVYVSLPELLELALRGSPLVLNALEEGSVLYDDGTVAQLRQRILARR